MIILGAAGSYWPLNWMANLVGACLVVLVVVLSARRGRVQAGVPAS
jgi:formate/nitrite transporter FocA (FNT family)